MASQPGAGVLETLTMLRDWGLKLGAIANAVQPTRQITLPSANLDTFVDSLV